jgi:H+/Cl- antiporter ClcA
MNNPRIWRGVLIAVVGVGIAVAIAAGAYQIGLEHGLASGVEPHAWSHGGHGFFFAPFFFLFLLLLMGRLLFWRRSWRGGCRTHDGVPPAFEEWHRRAHEQQTPSSPPAK